MVVLSALLIVQPVKSPVSKLRFVPTGSDALLDVSRDPIRSNAEFDGEPDSLFTTVQANNLAEKVFIGAKDPYYMDIVSTGPTDIKNFRPELFYWITIF